MQVALITGGAGFYGSHLCRRLAQMEWSVHATSRSKRKDASGKVVFHQVDPVDHGQLMKLVEKVRPDVVYHLAGAASAAPRIELVLPTFHSQVTSALNLLTIGHDLEVGRIVLIGSLMEPIGHTLEVIPSSPYSAAKLAVVHNARMFHELFQTPVTIVKPFLTFGPNQHESHVLPYTITTVLGGGVPRLSSGSWQGDWIYVDDVIEGLALAGTRPEAVGQVIELGRGELHSVREMVERALRAMGSDVSPHFGALPDRPDEPVRKADLSAAKRLLGWEPSVDLDEAMLQTVAWYGGHRGPGSGHG